MGYMYTTMTSTDGTEVKEATTDLWDVLEKVEDALPGGNTFTGNFSLVDAAFAPVFMRLMMLKSVRENAAWKKLPKTRKWADALLALPEVKDSVIPEFKERYVSYLTKRESPALADLV